MMNKSTMLSVAAIALMVACSDDSRRIVRVTDNEGTEFEAMVITVDQPPSPAPPLPAVAGAVVMTGDIATIDSEVDLYTLRFATNLPVFEGALRLVDERGMTLFDEVATISTDTAITSNGNVVEIRASNSGILHRFMDVKETASFELRLNLTGLSNVLTTRLYEVEVATNADPTRRDLDVLNAEIVQPVAPPSPVTASAVMTSYSYPMQGMNQEIARISFTNTSTTVTAELTDFTFVYNGEGMNLQIETAGGTMLTNRNETDTGRFEIDFVPGDTAQLNLAPGAGVTLVILADTDRSQSSADLELRLLQFQVLDENSNTSTGSLTGSSFNTDFTNN